MWHAAVIGVLAVMLAGCGPAASPPPDTGPGTVPPTGSAVERPTFVPPTETIAPSPTPAPYLPADRAWIGVQGFGDSVLSVTAAGEVQAVRLPINEGQRISDPAASPDGRYLAYLVWDEDVQHGIALWELTSPNARLIARPLEGYRIVGLLFADDGSRLAHIQVQQDVPIAEADWRIEWVDPAGGAGLLLTREELGSSFPPAPVAWISGGPLLVNAVNVDGTSQGVYAYNPESGQGRFIVTPDEGGVIQGALLSPDSTRVAYLGLPPNQPASGEAAPGYVLHIYDVRLNETITMTPPAGRAIVGMRWHPDGERLLLDLIDAAGGTEQQSWALVSVGQPPPWPELGSAPGRDRLFDYEPWGEGVLYTLLPADEQWRGFILKALTEDAAAAALPISLEPIARQEGAPVIIYIPVR
ncbi:MAG: hypothetical protein Kow00124_14510 [Anaerolineae bacterium]